MGDPDAQSVLAGLYERGWGVPQDIARAARLYERSARQGFAPSQAMIAGLYQSGYGVPKDLERARYWFSECARQGDAACAKSLRSLSGPPAAPSRPTPMKLGGPAAVPAAAAPAPAAPAGEKTPVLPPEGSPLRPAPTEKPAAGPFSRLSPLQHVLIGAVLGLCAAGVFFLLVR